MHNFANFNKESKEKKILVLFLHDSTGELFVNLPILWYLKRSINLEIYFVSSHADIVKRMNISKRYLEIMHEVGNFYFGNLKSIQLLINLFFIKNSSIIQMSCNLGARRIDRIYYSILKNSTMVFFTHAFMLHPFNNIKKAVNDELISLIKSQFFANYGNHSDLLIINSEESKYFEETGWPLDSLHVVGAIGYSKEWLKYLLKLDTSQKEINENQSLTIFVPLRDSHKFYLTENNYDYLISSLTKIFKKFKQHSFIVKLHPRQNPKDIIEIYSKYSNVYFSNQSPFELALKSDLAIGFWSSALTDSVAVGTPAIEFHKHEVPHSQLVLKNKKLISLNEYLGLCIGFDDVEMLKDFLSNININKLKSLQKNQHENLLNCYNLNESDKDRLLKTFEKHFIKASKAKNEQKNEKSLFIIFKKIIFKFFILPLRIFR